MRVLSEFVFYMALGLLVPSAALGVPVNGDFENGLDSWTASGIVNVTNGGPPGNDVALLYNGFGDARLFQGVALPQGQYVIEFDFFNALSLESAFGFPDTFFASLYFTDDLNSFDIDNLVFDDAIPLLDFDIFNMDPHGGAVTQSAFFNEPLWMHYAIAFSNNYSYAVPVFELLNLGSRGNFVALDNVTITEAPVAEPGTLLLITTGLFGFAVRRRAALRS